MNKELLLVEVIDLAKTINKHLNHKDSIKFYTAIEESLENSDVYKFIKEIMYTCSRKYIEIPESFGKILTYDKNLHKEIMYTFVLNSKINEGSARERLQAKRELVQLPN